MAIEIRQTKRALAYRVVIPPEQPGGERIVKSFRTKSAAEAWERETLAGRTAARANAPRNAG